MDTHIALELLLFSDPRCQPLRALLSQGDHCWLATPAMRTEFEHVIQRPQLQRWQPDAEQLLRAFDQQVRQVGPAAPSSLRCRDPDDQMFIDLALAHAARALLTRDRALLALRGPAALLGVTIGPPEKTLG